MKSLLQVTLIAALAAITINFTTPALAGGGGGGGGEGGAGTINISNDKKTSTNKKKKSGRKVSVIYTQKNFHKISDKDLKTAIKGNKTGHNIVVEGFSKRMSTRLFEMALIDKNWLVRVMNFVGKKKKIKNRKEYLRLEELLADDQLDLLKEDLVTILFPKDPEVIKYKARLKLMKEWARKPKEGTLKTKK